MKWLSFPPETGTSSGRKSPASRSLPEMGASSGRMRGGVRRAPGMRSRRNSSSIQLCDECEESNRGRDSPVERTSRAEARESKPVWGRKCSKCKTWIGKPHFQIQVLNGRLAEPLDPIPHSVRLKPSVWRNLPQECLEMILARLPLGSRVRFSVVSKAWQSLLASSDFKRLCDSVEAPSAMPPVCCLQYQLGEVGPPRKPRARRPAEMRQFEVVKVGLSFLPPKFRAFRPSDYVVQDGLVCIFKVVKVKREKVEGETQHAQMSGSRSSGAGLWDGVEEEDDGEDDAEDEEGDPPPRPPHPEKRGNWTSDDVDEENDEDQEGDEQGYSSSQDEDMYDEDSDSDEDVFDEDSDYDEDVFDEDSDEGIFYLSGDEDDDDDWDDGDEEDEREDDYYGHCERKHFDFFEQPGFRCDRSVVCSSGNVVGMSFCVANPIMRTFTELPLEFGKRDDFDDRRACWRFQLEVDASGHFTVIVLCQRISEPTVSIYRSKDNSWTSTALTHRPLWFTQSLRYDDDSSYWPQYVLCNGELVSVEQNYVIIHCLKSSQVIWDSWYRDNEASNEDEEDEDTKPRVICKVFAWRGRTFCLEQDYEERKVDFGVWELERSPYVWRKVSFLPEHLQKMVLEPGRSSKLSRRHITATFSGDTMYFRMGTGKPDDRICTRLCRHLVGYNILDNRWSVIRDGGLAFNCMLHHLYQPNDVRV